MAKYEARHIKDERFIVYKRRWFGLLPPLSRIAIWDGYRFTDSTYPDFHWESSDGGKSSSIARFRARWALLREWKRWQGLLPNDWSEGIPVAQLMERATR